MIFIRFFFLSVDSNLDKRHLFRGKTDIFGDNFADNFGTFFGTISVNSTVFWTIPGQFFRKLSGSSKTLRFNIMTNVLKQTEK